MIVCLIKHFQLIDPGTPNPAIEQTNPLVSNFASFCKAGSDSNNRILHLTITSQER